MSVSQSGKHGPNSVQLHYQLIRNMTSPDEKSVDVQSFALNLPAIEILKLDTKANLRSYLAEDNPKKRNRVHEAIRETIETLPQRFIIRNSGFVATATNIEVDDKNSRVTLFDASIINGAQSQGEVRRYVAEITDPANNGSPAENPFYVRLFVIVDDDQSEVVETAIARNIATPVKSLTEAGARSQLDDLERSIKSAMPNAQIRKSESQSGPEYIDTRKVLQLARLLMPTEVSGNPTAAEKLRAYKNPEQCLTDFCDWYQGKGSDPAKKRKYDFTVDIAPHALAEYAKWARHLGWTGHKIWSETKKGGRAIRRDRKTKAIVWVSPGLLFPLMGAMSEFAMRDAGGHWRLEMPKRFKEEEMIQRAVNQFRAFNSDPMMMGRSEAAYDALRIYPQTLVEVLREMAAEQ